ncbi:hypothetical protein LX32DRAFT_567868 [Colletotrichum zoysiae]|uniref:Uncharacterized protein n=1 Tax=Colletotrichum zoysiae TaxID=1216348 RepID=A0AAD9LYE9_9PEZI|nr:hypothetical protein LX32DRAFT_567868 [Colletotrichum zoysiae]
MARKDIAQIVKDLHRKDSHRDTIKDRSAAIYLFGKTLWHADLFEPAWNAVGGAAGLARLMAEFSAYDVRSMCRRLGNTAYAQDDCPERRESIGKLVRLLYDNDQKDDRPLMEFYQEIVPACSLEMVQEWEQERKVKWSEQQLYRIWRCHRERHEQDFLQELSSPDTSELKFQTHRSLFGKNLQFCDTVLSMIITKGEHVQIPSDFTTKFVMPLLRRLLRGRYNAQTRDSFLDLTIQCFQRHEGVLAKDIHFQPGGLLQYTIQRWIDTRGDRREEMNARVAKLLALLPTKEHPLGLEEIYNRINVPRNLSPEAKYDLLRLFFRHVKGYETSLEDESAPGLVKLRDLATNNNTWPTKLFFTIDIDNGRRLFERLATADPTGDFLKFENDSHKKTVTEQTGAPGNSIQGDVEIVRCLLNRRSESESRDQAWLDRACSIVEERKKKAQQSHDANDCAFWAKSALNLCFAAGDLNMVSDTVLWARRFNKDTLTAKEFYGHKTWSTQEAQDLLCAIPEDESLAARLATSDSIAREIRLANKIILDLFETLAMVAKEPEYSDSQWAGVLELPQNIALMRFSREIFLDQVMESAGSDDISPNSAEILWKPILDVLLEVRGIRSGSGVLWQMKRQKPSILAYLAKSLLSKMKQHLGEEGMSYEMRSEVEIVIRCLITSDQPALACPFMRDLIMTDPDIGYSLEREIINVHFLSSLPAMAAREFLHTMAHAIREKMREQNSAPFNQVGDKPEPSVIKATTIDLMAQVLQNNFYIDAISSGNILTGLLAEVRHIDAKTALVSNLIKTLKIYNCPVEVRIRILDALAVYAVPTAAQLSERRPLSEADWAAAAEDQGTLPEADEEAPLLAMMLSQATIKKLSPEDKSEISQFIATALEKSAVHNRRWMELFLAKNGFALGDNKQLPLWPVRQDKLALFFKDWVSNIPVSLFQVHCSVILTRIDPTPDILRITEAVKSNQELASSNAGKHWIAQFDGFETGKLPLYVLQASDFLIAETEVTISNSESTNRVTLRMVQDLLLSVAEKFVRKGDNRSLYSLRTAQLHVFPNMFKIKTMTLPIPYTSGTRIIHPSPEQVDAFIAELSGLVDELSSLRKPYYGGFALFKGELLKALRKEDYLYYAWKLGILCDAVHIHEPSLADYLRIELVGELLLYSDYGWVPANKDNLPKAKEMFYAWKESKSEDLRSMAFIIEDKLRDRGQRDLLKRP